MVKQTKSQRLREKIKIDIKHSKQTTLDDLQEPHELETSKMTVPEPKKQIEITGIDTFTKEDELELKVGFRLVPSKAFFSRLTCDLFFDKQKIDSLRLRVLQGPLSTEESEFSTVLVMTGIGEGRHTLRVEMYELWGSWEKLASTSKEAIIDYVPVKSEDTLIRIPTIKSTTGSGLDIITERERNIYREIEKDVKEESEGRRDYW